VPSRLFYLLVAELFLSWHHILDIVEGCGRSKKQLLRCDQELRFRIVYRSPFNCWHSW